MHREIRNYKSSYFLLFLVKFAVLSELRYRQLSFFGQAPSSAQPNFFTAQPGLQIRNANSHDCEKLRSEANSLRFASHKIDSTSLRFRFAIFKTRSLSLRFRNWNRLRIRRAKFAKNSLFSQHFSRFLRAQFQWSVIFKLEYSFEYNIMLR